MRTDSERLQDMFASIERIERHTKDGRAHFEDDELIQTWVIHHLEILGEAARGISETLRAAHPDVPWPQIAALRNFLVHDYFGINLDNVWTTVERDLPILKTKIRQILATERPGSGE